MDEFAKKLESMKSLFQETERQFLEVSHIIPLDNDLKTYSPRFYNILQFSCAQVHSLFKMICSRLDLKVEYDNFPEYYKILNQKGMLEKQMILLIHNVKVYNPFKTNKHHEWWAGYNDTKHDLPDGIKQGTLGNVIDAITAVFALINIANLTRWHHNEPEKLLDGNNWHPSMIPYDDVNLQVALNLRSQNPVDSNLFHLITQFGLVGAPI